MGKEEGPHSLSHLEQLFGIRRRHCNLETPMNPQICCRKKGGTPLVNPKQEAGEGQRAGSRYFVLYCDFITMSSLPTLCNIFCR